MTQVDGIQLPFLNRDQLNFKDGATYALAIRFRSILTDDIKITGITREGPFTFRIAPAGGGGIETKTFKIPDIPIFLSVSANDSNTYKNGVYIDIGLQVNGDVMLDLLSGYTYANKRISWPAATFETGMPPPVGRIYARSTNDPAAGNEISYNMPDNFNYHFKSFEVTLVTDATVANRVVHLRVTNSNGGGYEFISSVSQAASLTRTYHFQPIGGAGVYSDDNDIIVPIPNDIWGRYITTIATVTTGLVAGDNFGVMTMWTEEFLYDGI
jgi:hypothetical protein